MTNAERLILMNQLAIMAGLKSHFIMQHGNGPAESSIARLEEAIKRTVSVFQEAPQK